jgi:hypothetical protein
MCAGRNLEIEQTHVADIDLHFARFDFAQVENLVDEVEQIAARSPDRVGELDLFVGQVLFLVVREQFGQNQHRVERCAQLVAHVGQELRLVFGRERQLFGFFFQCGARQLDFAVLVLDLLVLVGQQRSALLPIRGPALRESSRFLELFLLRL